MELTYFYRPQTKLQECNVFACVCHSVHREGGASAEEGVHPPKRGVHPSKERGASTESGVHPLKEGASTERQMVNGRAIRFQLHTCCENSNILLFYCTYVMFYILFICHRKPSDIPAGNVQPFIAKIQQPQSEGQEPQDMIGLLCF